MQADVQEQGGGSGFPKEKNKEIEKLTEQKGKKSILKQYIIITVSIVLIIKDFIHTE